MNSIIFDEHGYAKETVVVIVHNYDKNTGEYIGSNETQVVEGTSVPEASVLDAPPALDKNQCAVFNGSQWTACEDLRGSTAYDKKTGSKVVINTLGSLPEGYIDIEPLSEYSVWNDSKGDWITDVNRLKAVLIAEADNTIKPLSEELEEGIITDSDKEKRSEWIKYRQAIRSLHEGSADIVWPEKPV